MDTRIKNLLAAKRLSPSAFADAISVPRSTISHVLSGRNKPSLDLILKILDAFPDIRTEWLVRGKGSMLTGAPDLFTQPGETMDIAGHNTDNQTGHSMERGKSSDISGEDRSGDTKNDAGIASVRSEPEMPFSNRTGFGMAGKRVVQIVTIYSDETFSIYYPSAGRE